MNYTRYDIESGRILGWFGCSPGIRDLQLAEGEGAIDGNHDPATLRVVAGEVVARPAGVAASDKASIAADGLEVATVTGIPAGARVYVIGPVPYKIASADGQALEFTTDTPGLYTVRVEAFPAQLQEIEIDAT